MIDFVFPMTDFFASLPADFNRRCRFTVQQAPKNQRGGFFVEGLVVITALGALDAARATIVAGALFDQGEGRGEPLLDNAKARLGDPDPAGVGVVDKDRRGTDLGMVRGGDAADVVAITEGKEREQADTGVLDRVNSPSEVQPSLGELFDQVLG